MSLVDISSDERKRFESFKLGGQAPAQTTGGRHAHARSHSRNGSISVPMGGFTFPAAAPPAALTESSTAKPSRPLSMPPLAMSLPNAAPPMVASSKRNSHHRRRSSVSTRHESAELMGVSLPELPASTSDDNVNLGQKDSIRRRALWALEGKPDVAFSKVEIPDMHTPDIEKMMFDFSNKPSLASGSNSSSFGNVMGNKRDSFKLLGTSSSSKDQLGTLLEEEEEEEDSQEQEPCVVEEPTTFELSLPSPSPSVKDELPPTDDEPLTPTPVVAVTQPTPAKPRPATLNLRPLSLTPDTLITATSGLPTPTLTPSPRPGLRSLSLSPSPASVDNDISNPIKLTRRSSLVLSTSPTPGPKRPTLNLTTSHLTNAQAKASVDENERKLLRRSSISYKRSSSSGSGSVGGVTINSAGLPTPEMTPTLSRRYSNASESGISSASAPGFISDDDQSFQFFRAPQTQEAQAPSRPLSTSEQHFLFKSHNALLARITDLERALSMRKRESWSTSSRPLSTVSTSPSFLSEGDGTYDSFGGTNNEMLHLVADLKAERDELKRDVEGWRQRVANFEKQVITLAQRVEYEKKEAWVARSRVGILEVEKEGLERAMSSVEEKLHAMEREMGTVSMRWGDEREELTMENMKLTRRVEELEVELRWTRSELERARSTVLDPLATPTPNGSFANVGLGFGLSDSTHVDPAPFGKMHGFGFMSVDSEASTTDVEPDSASDDGTQGYPLKTLQEESIEEDDGEVGYRSEDYEDNGLAGYEDEDEETDNVSFGSSSSFGSVEEIQRTVVHLQQMRAESPTTPRPGMAFQRPTHQKRASLSQPWTFPKAAPGPLPLKVDNDSVDLFFGCLQDDATRPSASDAGSIPSSPSAYSYEKTKGLFAKAAKQANDDNASFFLPFGDGDGVEEETDGMGSSGSHERYLSLIDEEEEEEEEEEVEQLPALEDEVQHQSSVFGGITITFTPPQEDRYNDIIEECEGSPTTSKSGKRVSPPPVLPALDLGLDDLSFDGVEDEEEEGDVFNFTRPLTLESAKPTIVETRPVIEQIKAIVSSTCSPSSSSSSSLPQSVMSSVRSTATSSPTSMIPRSSSPSSIPRSTSRSSRSSTSTLSTDSNASSPSQSPVPSTIPLSCSPTKATTPLKASAVRASSLPSGPFSTPPTKRGGSALPQPTPSRIIRPSSSPAPSSGSSSKTRSPASVPQPTFIRQPSRKPLLPSGSTNGSTMIPQPAPILSEDVNMNSYSFRFPGERIAQVADGFESGHGQSPTQMISTDDAGFGFDDTCYDRYPPLLHTRPFNASSGSSPSPFVRSYPSTNVPRTPSRIVASPHVCPSTPVSSPSSAPLFKTLMSFSPWGSKTPVVPPAPYNPRFIPKEGQLRRLQTRMQMEGVVAMSACVQVHCEKCIQGGEIICL